MPLRFIVMALKLRDQVVLIDSGTGGHPMGTAAFSRAWRRQALTPKQSRRSLSPISTATTFMA
jgi:ribulose 1,5-bisphosphate carboxylase large subunit-like protein